MKHKQKKKNRTNKDITHLIGCTGIFDKKGNLNIHPNLKTLKMADRSAYPEYRIIGDDNQGNVLLTIDGMFISSLPKKFIKEIKIEKKSVKSKGRRLLNK